MDGPLSSTGVLLLSVTSLTNDVYDPVFDRLLDPLVTGTRTCKGVLISVVERLFETEEPSSGTDIFVFDTAVDNKHFDDSELLTDPGSDEAWHS